MAVSQLGYLGFGVSSIDAWETYATDVLGLEISERADDGTFYLRMDENHHRVALHPTGEDDLAYVGWQTANRGEFEATKAKLLAGGVEYAQGSEEEIANRHVVDLVKFGVSGINMEVFFGSHVLFERPFKPSTPLQGFKTGELGMGHVGLNPDDADEVMRVLRDCLDFRVSDSLGGGERFFHCNPREHVAVVASRPGTKRIGHFMIELNSLDDVGFCLDRCEDQGVEIIRRLGKHTNDHMVSFYMSTPSGFGLEYGWGARVIDDDNWQVQRYDKASIWGHRPPLEKSAASGD